MNDPKKLLRDTADKLSKLRKGQNGIKPPDITPEDLEGEGETDEPNQTEEPDR